MTVTVRTAGGSPAPRRRLRSRSSSSGSTCRAASARTRRPASPCRPWRDRLQPLAPCGPDLEARLDAVVEAGDGLHALLRRHLALGPEVLLVDAHQRHEVHALVVERVVRPARSSSCHTSPMSKNQSCSPTIILTGALTVLRISRAERQLLRRPSCARSPPNRTKSGCGIERVDVVDRLEDRAHEAVVELSARRGACPRCRRR